LALSYQPCACGIAAARHCALVTEKRHQGYPHDVLPLLLVSARWHRSLASDSTSEGFHRIPERTRHIADHTCICIPTKGRPMVLTGESCAAACASVTNGSLSKPPQIYCNRSLFTPTWAPHCCASYGGSQPSPECSHIFRVSVPVCSSKTSGSSDRSSEITACLGRYGL
jgi:hypothetical protein